MVTGKSKATPLTFAKDASTIQILGTYSRPVLALDGLDTVVLNLTQK